MPPIQSPTSARPRSVQLNRLSGISLTASHDDPRVIAALEKYLALCEEVAPPDRQAFLAEFPDIAGVLGPCLEGLALVQAAVPGVSGEGPAPGLRFPLPSVEGLTGSDDDSLLGDFRIIREIGRGGMGIVYEAEQRSLSRRVALKILPFAAVLDPRHLQRFKNEALAAAHLDHPNIVEVYGVGCERGVHFYAMRYVEGQTLAAVIEAMKDEGQITKDESSRLAPRDETPLPQVATDDCGGDIASVGNGLRAVPEAPRDVEQADSIRPSSLVLRNSADTVRAPIAALSTLRTERPRDFFRLVAEFGIQAAEALDHAHQMGIVHRDIKPSNLLVECRHLPGAPGRDETPLPSRGEAGRGVAGILITDHRPLTTPKLWITDFGLAHIETGVTLTMTGDLLGTLRYMSPEQAEGKSAILDHRTDIYSLGVTLYEFITKQPAFGGAERQELLRQIAYEEPVAIRRVTPSAPVELETIVLKALAKNPNERFTSAKELADDLRRFIEHKPIRARRPTVLQRLRHWGQRHIGLIAAAAILLLLTTGIAGLAAVVVARSYQSESTALLQARDNLTIARQAVNDMYVQVAEKWLADEPQLESLQRDFLLKAAQFYKKFAEQEDNNVDARFDVAVAYRRCGEVHEKLGEWENGKAAFDEAIRRFQSLLEASPGDAKFRTELAKSCLARGLMDGYVDAPRMLSDSMKALELWRELHRESPHEVEYRRSLITTAGRLTHELAIHATSDVQRRMSRELDAEVDQLARKLVRDDSTSKGFEILGDTLRGRGDRCVYSAPERAEKFFQEAIEAFEASSRLDPRSSIVRDRLGNTYRLLTVALLQLGRNDEARKAAQRGIDIYQQLIDDFPRLAGYRTGLGAVYVVLSSVLLQDNDLDAAREYTALAIESFSQAWTPINQSFYTADFLLERRRSLIHLLEQQHDEAEIERQLAAYRKELAELVRQSVRLPGADDAEATVIYRLGALRDISCLEAAHVLQLAQRATQWIVPVDLPRHTTFEAWESDPVLKIARHFMRPSSTGAPLVCPEFDSLDAEQKHLVIRSAVLLAALYFHLGHHVEAAPLMEFACARIEPLIKTEAEDMLDPVLRRQMAGTLTRIGYQLSRLGKRDEARRAFERARSIAPADFVGWARGGIDLVFNPEATSEDRRLGIEQLTHAVAVEPGGWRYPLALAQYRAGKYPESLANFNEVVRGHRERYGGALYNEPEGTAWDFFYVSMNHARLGHRKEARHWFDRGVAWMKTWDPASDPNNRDGRFPSTDWMERNVPGYSDLRALHKEAIGVLEESFGQAAE